MHHGLCGGQKITFKKCFFFSFYYVGSVVSLGRNCLYPLSNLGGPQVFIIFIFCLFTVMCVCVCMFGSTHGGQKTACRNHFSHSSMDPGPQTHIGKLFYQQSYCLASWGS